MNPESPSSEDVLKLGDSSRYLGLAAACSEMGQQDARHETCPHMGLAELISSESASQVLSVAVRTLPGSANVGTVAKMGWLENQAP